MELALGKYVIPAPSPSEIDELMSLPEGTPVQRGEEIRHTIFELLVVIVEQDPPKLPENYFCNEFCQLIDMCLQVECITLESVTKLTISARSNTKSISRIFTKCKFC